MQKETPRKTKIINSNAIYSPQIRSFKKKALDGAIKELNKIEKEIEELERNNKN